MNESQWIWLNDLLLYVLMYVQQWQNKSVCHSRGAYTYVMCTPNPNRTCTHTSIQNDNMMHVISTIAIAINSQEEKKKTEIQQSNNWQSNVGFIFMRFSLRFLSAIFALLQLIDCRFSVTVKRKKNHFQCKIGGGNGKRKIVQWNGHILNEL